MVGVTLDEFQKVPDLAPLWRHRVQMPAIEGIVIPPAQIVGGSFTFPFVDSEARAHSGSYTYYPQFNNIDAIDITFQEAETYEVTKYLYRWLNLVVSGEDGTYRESNYFKRNIVLTMFNNQDDETLQIRYNGTFPTRITNIDVSENDEYYRVSCNFSVDSNTPEFDIGTGDFLSSSSPSNVQRATRTTNTRASTRELTRTALQTVANSRRTDFGSQITNLIKQNIPSTGNQVVDNLVQQAVNSRTRGFLRI